MDDMIRNSLTIDAELIRDEMATKHGRLIDRKEELLSGAARIPDITDDEISGRVADFIKQLTSFVKIADTTREAEKAPYLEGGRSVDGYFKSLTGPIEAAKKGALDKQTIYLRIKEAAERKRRQEEADRAREAQRLADEEMRRKAGEMVTQQGLVDAVAAEDRAEQAAADAATAARAAQAKAADLSRVRGDYGATNSLVTFWDFSDLDRAALDLEALRQHIPLDALEKAVRSYIKADGRDLRGVRIFENTRAR